MKFTGTLKNLGKPLDGARVKIISEKEEVEGGGVTVTCELLQTVNKAYQRGSLIDVAKYEMERDK